MKNNLQNITARLNTKARNSFAFKIISYVNLSVNEVCHVKVKLSCYHHGGAKGER
jgi:hypothetical protein